MVKISYIKNIRIANGYFVDLKISSARSDLLYLLLIQATYHVQTGFCPQWKGRMKYHYFQVLSIKKICFRLSRAFEASWMANKINLPSNIHSFTPWQNNNLHLKIRKFLTATTESYQNYVYTCPR